MNKDEAGGNWRRPRGRIGEQWDELTSDDMTIIEGKRGQLVGKIRESYGYQKNQAGEEAGNWEKRHDYRW